MHFDYIVILYMYDLVGDNKLLSEKKQQQKSVKN